MDKKAIGFKIEWNMSKVILSVLGGIIIAASGIFCFIFVIGGAIGGGIAGCLIACGGMLCTMGVGAHSLPNELVYVDDKSVYLNKIIIELEQIKNASFKGGTLIITPKQGRMIRQGFLKNSQECAKHINEKLQQNM